MASTNSGQAILARALTPLSHQLSAFDSIFDKTLNVTFAGSAVANAMWQGYDDFTAPAAPAQISAFVAAGILAHQVLIKADPANGANSVIVGPTADAVQATAPVISLGAGQSYSISAPVGSVFDFSSWYALASAGAPKFSFIYV